MQNSFLTLTYDDEHLPKGGTLDPDDIKKFMYRYRNNLKKEGYPPIRYYLVGEYGDKTERPHYHAAIFGVSCNGPNPRYYNGKKCNCNVCRITHDSWKNGFIGIGTLENDSASYIAGYIQKTVKVDGKAVMGLTNKKDPLVQNWLKGRHPEFTRMSRRPGIGGDSVDNVVAALKSTYGDEYVDQHGDVPFQLTHGGQSYSIGRYLRECIRREYGFKKKTTLKGSVSYAPEDSMLKLSEKKNNEQLEIHAKAKSISKDPYQYEKDLKNKKIKSQEIKAAMHAKTKGDI